MTQVYRENVTQSISRSRVLESDCIESVLQNQTTVPFSRKMDCTGLQGLDTKISSKVQVVENSSSKIPCQSRPGRIRLRGSRSPCAMKFRYRQHHPWYIPHEDAYAEASRKRARHTRDSEPEGEGMDVVFAHGETSVAENQPANPRLSIGRPTAAVSKQTAPPPLLDRLFPDTAGFRQAVHRATDCLPVAKEREGQNGPTRPSTPVKDDGL